MTPDPPTVGPHEEQAPPAPALGPVPMEPVAPPERRGRAGRDLVAASTVGLALAALVVLSLRIDERVFVGVVSVAAALGVLELGNALATAGLRVPLIPALVGSSTLPVAAYAGGPEWLLLALAATVLALVAWRLAQRDPASTPVADAPARAVADSTAGIFAVLYVAFLASFAVLMVRPDDGVARVLTFVVLTVLSDTGGYVAGVLFGRHLMAPSISPKKSWEGFLGSATFSAAGGALIVTYLAWGSVLEGALIGVAVMLTATIGDLGESMIKRDIGVKDMGNLLPGHGGLMDRLDSLLPAAPVAYLLLSWIAPT